MFRDLVQTCGGHQQERLSKLEEDMKADSAAGLVIPPTGFVFHESRCGSTLVANLLGSDPSALTFVESQPPADILSSRQPDAVKIRHLRIVMNQMGRSTTHTRLYFKFQSVLTLQVVIVGSHCGWSLWVVSFFYLLTLVSNFLF